VLAVKNCTKRAALVHTARCEPSICKQTGIASATWQHVLKQPPEHYNITAGRQLHDPAGHAGRLENTDFLSLQSIIQQPTCAPQMVAKLHNLGTGCMHLLLTGQLTQLENNKRHLQLEEISSWNRLA